MIDLAGSTYDDHKACIVCQHVLGGLPVLAFAHDEGGDLHFTCGTNEHVEDDWQVVGLSHLLEQLRSISGLPVVHAGYCAERTWPGGPWSLEALS